MCSGEVYSTKYVLSAVKCCWSVVSADGIEVFSDDRLVIGLP